MELIADSRIYGIERDGERGRMMTRKLTGRRGCGIKAREVVEGEKVKDGREQE